MHHIAGCIDIRGVGATRTTLGSRKGGPYNHLREHCPTNWGLRPPSDNTVGSHKGGPYNHFRN
jgi:hypothetical protein